jgi:uncharacterized protein (TIGR02270 family)
VSGLLISANPLWRQVGITACAIYRVDPGKFLDLAIQDDNPQLRARTLRATGELGRIDLKSALLDQINNQDSAVGFWAAWSAVLWGDRGRALSSLQSKIIEGSDFSLKAMPVALRVLDLQQAKKLLKALVQSGDRAREAIIGAGISGDPSYMLWLIKQMELPKLARAAGESFSFICGADIAYEDLEDELPKNFAAGPTENPEDEEVAMDQDDDLPCPGALLIDRWWKQHQQNFKPGVRYLSGKPMNEPQYQDILKTGKQRQRQAAALELALTRPKQPLFETRAMGKRQQQWLS